MRTFLLAQLSLLAWTVSSAPTNSTTPVAANSTQSCNATFTPVTASAAFAALNPGWNLGNTLDATPTEGSWNNGPAQASTFSTVQAGGFKSVRIPVTWAYHYVDSSPSWTINSTWMDRVETVVDEALSLGLYVILNMHHDSWIWADVSASGANYTLIEEKFAASWSQIGARFACKSSKLIFEPINEPPGTTQAHADELNKLNQIFLKSINDAGGYNPQRVVSLVGLQMNAALTAQYFVRGTTYSSQPWGLQFHYYSPYDFIFEAWGKTIWGSDADKASLDSDFSLYAGNFTDVPTFVGEWDASTATPYTETAGRWKYFDYFVRTCNKYGYASVLWDNGNDHFNRTTGTWNDPVAIDILMSATKNITNTLADSTTDQSATSQNSSAYLFHEVGTPVMDQSVAYLLNGNTLGSIKSSAGTTLDASSYSMSTTGTLTFTSAYLSTLFTNASTPGTKETLSLSFSTGADLSLSIIQYSTPTLPTATYALSNITTSSDLYIPITYAGLPIPAAVKALKADGTYLADDYTQYFGPMEAARWTYGSWSYDANHFIVYAAGLQVLQAAAQTVTLTLEFFPRTLGLNSVNLTFTQ
ncbi:hypothetical protein BP6252_11459 [Coleophoma cylindrospora]|uniref:Glycoside hydrolase family 5 domain-containing protein n=1 Tax=Coleophoma cylindrospora TaxID=1849047 RepID=A0A3D8QJM6_9HELO|nr:hypothetical protein BP6252_11459 [Coleophoma cylindrospora]